MLDSELVFVFFRIGFACVLIDRDGGCNVV